MTTFKLIFPVPPGPISCLSSRALKSGHPWCILLYFSSVEDCLIQSMFIGILLYFSSVLDWGFQSMFIGIVLYFSSVLDWRLQWMFIGLFSLFFRRGGLPDHRDLHVQAEEVQLGDVCGHARASGRGHEVPLRCQRLHTLAGYVISFIHLIL